MNGTAMLRRNFFIFATFKKYFNIDLKHCIYGADVSRSGQRGIGNAKRGDLALIWVYEDSARETKNVYKYYLVRLCLLFHFG